MKTLSEYIHLYIGSMVHVEGRVLPVHRKRGLIITGVDFGSHGNKLITIRAEDSDKQYLFDVSEIKPILRKTSSMTFDERQHDEDIIWLLRNGFDLFNLIDENLAIDSSTLVG